MVTFGDSCLEFKYQSGVSCGRASNSALRSAMIPHSSFLRQKLPKENNNTWMQGWDVSTFETGKTFSLGERGKLRLKSNLGRDGLVMEWSSHFMKIAIRSKMGREQVHLEYTEIDHSEEGKIDLPVPIIIISERPREFL